MSKTNSAAETLQKAFQLHQAGQLNKADRLYTALLKKHPNNGDALNLKGVISYTQGRLEEALTLFDRVTAVLPTFADAHFNKANCLKALNRNDDALAAYTKAIALKPDYADARLNAGTLLQKMERISEAIDAFRDMVRTAPADPRGHYNLGVCLTESITDTQDGVRAAIADEAEKALKRALALAPNDAKAHFAAANLHATRGDHETAIQFTKNAIKLDPNWPEAHANLGSHLEASGNLEAAETAFDHALKLDPENTNALVNRSLARLARGHLEKGWDDYARRFETSHALYTKREWPWPVWQGESLKGKKILVWSDQGIGDEILYGGMIPEIIQNAEACTVECAPRLVPLYQRSFPKADIVPKDAAASARLRANAFDYHSSVLDLGRWHRRQFGAFPNRNRYLRADCGLSERLRQRYLDHAPAGTRLMGLSWRSINPLIGSEKSLNLEFFAPILGSSKVRWINLQYGDTRDEIEKIKEKHGFQLVRDDGIDSLTDLDAFAAQVSALDGLVTISNSTAHMAAALGVPTILLIPDGRKRIWYWFGEGLYCPWYRSITIMRGNTDHISSLIKNFIDEI